MTKTKAPLFSFMAQGSLARAITYLRRRKTNIAEATPFPTDAKSDVQLSWRHMFNKCVDLWHTLSAAEHQEWESAARIHHMTGYAWYISQCLRPNPGIYLPLQGGTMSGDIDMDKYRLLKLPVPTDAQEAASKAYIDQALENFMWAKYLNDTPSGIGAYFEMEPTQTGQAKSTFTSGVLGTGDDQPLFQWISTAVVTFDTILAGVIDAHIHAERTAGNKSIKLYAKIYEYTDAAAEILIATTGPCEFLTNEEACLDIHAPLAADYSIAPTSKLLIKYFANVGAAGANVTINLYAEGTTTSGISLPTPTSPLIEALIAFAIAVHAALTTTTHGVGADYLAKAAGSQYTAVNRSGDSGLGTDFKRAGAALSGLLRLAGSISYGARMLLYGEETSGGRVLFQTPNAAKNAHVDVFKITGATDDPEVLPYIDDKINLGNPSKRWKLIRGVTITDGDHGFTERECSVCHKPFKNGDIIAHIVIGEEPDSMVQEPNEVKKLHDPTKPATEKVKALDSRTGVFKDTWRPVRVTITEPHFRIAGPDDDLSGNNITTTDVDGAGGVSVVEETIDLEVDNEYEVVEGTKEVKSWGFVRTVPVCAKCFRTTPP